MSQKSARFDELPLGAHLRSHTMRIIGVPIVQASIGILWMLLWGVSVSFLVSQVPADYTPTTAYATYAEAYGTSNETGACTDKWPTGSVYKDEGNCNLAYLGSKGEDSAQRFLTMGPHDNWPAQNWVLVFPRCFAGKPHLGSLYLYIFVG